MARRSRLSDRERDKILFPVCERFLVQRKDGQTQPCGRVKGSRIVDEIREEYGIKLNREDIYSLVREGVRRGLVRLCPPPNVELEEMLATRYSLDRDRVRVVDVTGGGTLDYLAAEAADLAAQCVAEIAHSKGSANLGLGSGQTTRAVARELARTLRGQPGIRLLTVHALTAGFAVERPDSSPVALFNFFDGAALSVKFVGLYAAPMVPVAQYAEQRKQSEIRKAITEGKKIDVVITSLASAEDEHGRFTQLSSVGGEAGLKELRKAGWVGDIQYRPFSREGAIEPQRGDRPVSLFEIRDLVRMAKDKNKHVILVAGPCGLCGKRKTNALEPLLRRPSLKAWNWLLLDVTTARELMTAC